MRRRLGRWARSQAHWQAEGPPGTRVRISPLSLNVFNSGHVKARPAVTGDRRQACHDRHMLRVSLDTGSRRRGPQIKFRVLASLPVSSNPGPNQIQLILRQRLSVCGKSRVSPEPCEALTRHGQGDLGRHRDRGGRPRPGTSDYYRDADAGPGQ